MVDDSPSDLDDQSRALAKPAENAVDTLRVALEDKNLPVVKKITLSMRLFRTEAEIFRDRLKTAAEVLKDKNRADEKIAKAAVTLYETRQLTQMQDAFLETMQREGFDVTMKQLNFLQEFAEAISQFSERLGGRHIKDEYKARILVMVDNSFELVCDRIDKLMGELVKRAEKK